MQRARRLSDAMSRSRMPPLVLATASADGQLIAPARFESSERLALRRAVEAVDGADPAYRPRRPRSRHRSRRADSGRHGHKRSLIPGIGRYRDSLICRSRSKVELRDQSACLATKGSTMIKLLSHLSYVEITSPDVEASVDVLREAGRAHRRRPHRRRGLPALLGRLLPLQRRGRARRRAVAGDHGVAHLQRRGARGSRQARRGRRHRGRVVRRPRDRPRLPLHRPVGSHA